MIKKKPKVFVDGPMKVTGTGIRIDSCTFNLPSFTVDANALAAITAVAKAAEMNAEAIKVLAERLGGPPDNRVALNFENAHDRT